MAQTENDEHRRGPGFEGEVAGMQLADVIQVNARNRFSGSVRVRDGESAGVIFLHDGRIVHAEQGGATGEEAFLEILQWQQGHFSVEQNVVTALRTIDKSCEHLILEAHRRLDERRAGRAPAIPPPQPQPPPARQPAEMTELIRRLPSVSDAVLVTGEGQCLSAAGPAAESLAGQAAYLVMFCGELGAVFDGGEIRFAAVEGTRQQMLLYASKSHRYLSVFAAPEAELGVVDGAVRSLLGKGR